MKFKSLTIIPIVLAATALAGCASESAKQVHLNLTYMTASSAPVQSGDANAQAQVAEAATSVGHYLQELSAIQMATHKGIKLSKPLNARAVGMAHQASLKWNGPVEPVVERIAHASKYRLRVIGSKPATAVIVNLNVKNHSLARILRNTSFQAEPAVTIKVYPKKRIIELRYNKQR